MQLRVMVPITEADGKDTVDERIVHSFRDVVSIGHEVARAVREWLRTVPMTPHPKQCAFYLTAEWVEDAKTEVNPAGGDRVAEHPPAKKRPARKRRG